MAVDTFVKPTSGAAYDSGTAYVVGDYVTSGGYDFRCIQNSTGNAPDTTPADTAYWTYRVYTTIPTGISNASRTTGGDGASTCAIEEDADYSGSVTSWPTNASGTERFTVTVKEGCRHAGYWGSGAKLTHGGNVFDITPHYVTIEWLRIEVTSTTFNAIINYGEGMFAFRNLLIKGPGSGTGHGIYLRSEAASEFTEVHACSIFGFGGSGVYLADGNSSTCYFTHNSITNCGYGIKRDTGTLTATANACLGNTTADFSGTMTQSYNWSSDSSATGTGAQTTISPHEVWQSPDEGDLRLCYSRQCADDCEVAYHFDGGVAQGWTEVTGTDVHADAALRGDYGFRVLIANTTSGQAKTPTFPQLTNGYLTFQFNRTAGNDTSDTVYLMRGYAGSTNKFIIEHGETGGTNRVRITFFTTGSGTKYGTWFTITPGTTYKVKIRLVQHASAGIVEWWIVAAASAFSTAQDSWTSLDTGSDYIDGLRPESAFANTGSWGYCYWDTIQHSPTDHDIPDDATTPYGDEFSDALTSYTAPGGAPSGPSYFPSTDITGATWSSYHVGPDDYSLYEGSPPASSAIPVIFHHYAMMRGSC